MIDIRVVAAGDACLVAEFEERIDVAVNARAVALADAFRGAPLAGVRDIVPTFRTVAVYFDPLATDVEALAARLHGEAARTSAAGAGVHAAIEIPVCYATEFAADLDDVARFAGATREQVVAIHSGADYHVFMLGFMPGFAYLGTVDPRIAVPRRSTPRLQVPAGSVAIAGQQTAVYPAPTPGGWNIIGRTPLRMVSLGEARPALLSAGDTVRFRPIDRREFDRLAREQEQS